MDESTTQTTRHFSPCASLAALGVKLRQLDLFEPIRKQVRIAQKTVKHTPIDKLYEAFMAMLAGAHGLVEINSRLRSDPARPPAFGRSQCAEQSVVQETLDAALPSKCSKWSRPWRASIVSRVRAIGILMQPTGSS